jgi:hypothetical protein
LLLFIIFTYDGSKIIYLWYLYGDVSVPEKPVFSKKLIVDVFTTYFSGEPYKIVRKYYPPLKK